MASFHIQSEDPVPAIQSLEDYFREGGRGLDNTPHFPYQPYKSTVAHISHINAYTSALAQ